MASKNKTNVPLDPNYDYEDPAMSWIDLVVATRELNRDTRMAMIDALLFTAKNSHWTHELWDQVMTELETPAERIVLDGDSDDDAAASKLTNLSKPEHHSYRNQEPWEITYTQKLDTYTQRQPSDDSGGETAPYEDSQWDQ